MGFSFSIEYIYSPMSMFKYLILENVSEQTCKIIEFRLADVHIVEDYCCTINTTTNTATTTSTSTATTHTKASAIMRFQV